MTDALASADPQRHQRQLAVLVAIGAALANGVFYLLSSAYFDDRVKRFGPQELADIGATRLHFAVFTGVVAIAAISALFAPRVMALVLAGITSLAGFAAAYGAISRGLPGVLATCGIILGATLPVLAWFLHVRSRAAWAALTSIFGVLSVVLLFGAPRIRGLLGGGLWTAMIVPGLLGVGLFALLQIRRDYRDGPTDPDPDA